MSALFSSVLYVVSNPVHLINVLYILGFSCLAYTSSGALCDSKGKYVKKYDIQVRIQAQYYSLY